jgi:lipoprotein-releasing system permease protein
VYKLLLCCRYLRTRYLAFACIISVMLGVATLIVVNSVMSGFSTKLKERLHGLLSDVVVESLTYNGFPDPGEKMERIRQDPYLRDRVEAMTATMEVFAMIQFRVRGEQVLRTVHVIGVDPEGRSRIGGFKEFLLHQKNSPHPSFELGPEARARFELNQLATVRVVPPVFAEPPAPGEKPPPEPPPEEPYVPRGAVVGFALAHYRTVVPDGKPMDIPLLEPGDEVVLTTVSGQRLAPVPCRFVVCDFFKSEMSEYDASYVFVPLDHLQHLRSLDDRATSIQIKLKNYADAKEVVNRLQMLFPGGTYQVETWEKKQGALLAAIAIEKGLLNVLLFLIIAVAGFGILAIFSMIVVEKTRDIGILKALGASNVGVMKIFLGYGLLLGVVGALLGTVLGLLVTIYINQIQDGIAHVTGERVFDGSVYYFDKIPTDIQPTTVLFVNLGALAIAVIFSVLPALRAAMLQPVQALRYE